MKKHATINLERLKELARAVRCEDCPAEVACTTTKLSTCEEVLLEFLQRDDGVEE